jgi:hypothetical protein
MPRILLIPDPHLSPQSALLRGLGAEEVETEFLTHDEIVTLPLDEIREHTYPG